jgi:hypothetical protein
VYINDTLFQLLLAKIATVAEKEEETKVAEEDKGSASSSDEEMTILGILTFTV